MTATATLISAPSSLARSYPRRRRARRVPAPLWVAIVAGIVGGLVFLRVIAAAAGDHGTPIAVAARDLVAGEPLAPADFRFVNASLPGSTLHTLLRRADVGRIGGQVATHTIAAGALVGRADVLVPSGPGRERAMSIPIDPSRAVGGTLRRGDMVDVVDSTGGDAVYVVTSAKVLAAGSQSGDSGISAVGSGGGKYAVTITVDDRTALRVAAAVTTGKVDIVRSTDAPPVFPAPPTTVASPPPTTVRR